LKSKKVLYALQGTGNGHVARAREIIPILQKYCQVDVWLGGAENEVSLPLVPTYLSNGIGIYYNRKGGISYWKTFWQNSFIGAVIEIFNAPVAKYDLVINDFEFVTARACKLRRVRCVQLSHQGSFKWVNSPRPKQKSFIGELILRYYSRASECYGFHFYPYGDNIFPPVIRSEIRKAMPVNQGHYTVYLPAFHHDVIINFLSSFYKIQWQVFSKFATKEVKYDNIIVKPINNDDFIESFKTCAGVLSGAGFETPSEAIHMGKKIAVLPINNQYEQYCNAAALKMEGSVVLDKLDYKAVLKIRKWILSPQLEPRPFPDFIERLLLSMM